MLAGVAAVLGGQRRVRARRRRAPRAGGAAGEFDAEQPELPGRRLVVTTAKSPAPDLEAQAEDVSRRLGAPFVRRGKRSLRDICGESSSGMAYLIRRVQRKNQDVEIRHEICDGLGGRVYANPRMWSIVKDVMGQPLMQAIAPRGQPLPESVIDATAGLGGTSLRIAHACGPSCHLTACEISAPLACLLDQGMRRLAAQGEAWSEAAARVEVVRADAGDLLRSRAAGRGADRPDVVYLNPCMDVSKPSQEDAFLHRIASLRPIARDVFEAAAACARRRVVLRHLRGLEPPFGLAETAVARVSGGRSDFLVVEV